MRQFILNVFFQYGFMCAVCVMFLWSQIKFRWASDELVFTALGMIVFGLPLAAAFEALWLAVSRAWRWMRGEGKA